MRRFPVRRLAPALLTALCLLAPAALVAQEDDDSPPLGALCTQRDAVDIEGTDRSNICPLTQGQQDDDEQP